MSKTELIQAADGTWFDAGASYLDTINYLPPDAILHMEDVVHATATHHVPRRKTIQSQVIWVQLVVHSFSAYDGQVRRLWLPTQRLPDQTLILADASMRHILQYRFLQNAWKATGTTGHRYLSKLIKAPHPTIHYLDGQEAPTLPLRVESSTAHNTVQKLLFYFRALHMGTGQAAATWRPHQACDPHISQPLIKLPEQAPTYFTTLLAMIQEPDHAFIAQAVAF